MRTRSIAALAAAILFAGGCTSTGTPASSDSSADREQLTVAMTWQPRTGMSPYTDDGYSLTRAGVTETLLRISDDGDVEPALAAAFDVVDDTTVRFTLRDGVTFHDGTALTAEAVVTALTAAQKAKPQPAALAGLELTITADDDKTVTVTAAGADPVLANRFTTPGTMILAPKAYQAAEQPDVVGTGTGPFELTEQPTTSGMTLTAFDQYWDGKPASSGMDVRFISDPSARIAGLRAGNLDIASDIPITQLGQLAEGQIVTIAEPRLTGAFLNTEGILSDPGLRSAAAQALSSEAVVQGAFQNHAGVATATLEGERWAQLRPDVVLPEPAAVNGEELTVATYDDRPELPAAVTIVADQLREAGFTVADPVVKSYTLMETDILGGTYDVVVTSHRTTGETSEWASGVNKAFGCEGSWNIGRLCDEAVDAAIAEAMMAPVGEERDRLTAEAEALGLSKASFVPLAHQRIFVSVREGVTGISTDPARFRMLTHTTG